MSSRKTPTESSDSTFTGRSVSYSQYSMWANCPQQWKLHYVDGHRGDSGIELVFGTSIHDTIQHWLTLYYNEAPIKARVFDMHEHFKSCFMEGVKKELILEDRQLTTPEIMMEYYLDGCDILDAMRARVKEWFPKSHTLVGVEVPLEIDVAPNVRFRGFLDVVLHHKAAKMIYIYDFKTSRFGWFSQKKDPKKLDQLLLYKKYYAQIFNVPEANIRVEFIILKRKLSENSEYAQKRVIGFEPSNGTVSMKRAEERFNKFLNLFDENGEPHLDQIVATPSDSACRYCIFQDNAELCPYSVKLPAKQRKIPIGKSTEE